MPQDLLYKPIILTGVGRSGTTIIAEILFQHRDLAWPSTYQNKFPHALWINKVRPLMDNKLWSLRGQKKQVDKIPFYKNYLFRPSEANAFWKHVTKPETNFLYDFLLNKQASLEEKQSIRNVFAKLVQYQKRKRLAFKLTGPGRIGYLKSIFPDAVFIEITRDPMANVRSLLKVPFWKTRGMQKLWWQGAYTKDEQEKVLNWKGRPALITAIQYARIREKVKEEAELHKAELYSFAYEDFVKDPHKTMTAILAVAGLSPSNAIDNYLKSLKIHERNSRAFDFFDEADREELKNILKVLYQPGH